MPVVATNVGTAINRVITDNENGLLVKTDDEWLEKLKYLIDNPTERARIGKNARQTEARAIFQKQTNPYICRF